ncbi:MAG: alpha/beta hydrolase [Dehalococcoidia bacterium]|nr:alpha/beta hydrolase [Dehalococcoidia bacterium]
MPNFVLVHGAWQGSWLWSRVAGELQSAGESRSVGQVVAVDLPGHGSRASEDLRRITTEHYVQAVTTPVQVGRLEDVVLVAHGFSAAFIPQVASELDGLVNRVVLIGGELPDDGRSVYDGLSPWQKLMTRVFKAGEKGILYPEPIFKGILCNGLDRDSTRLVLDGLVPEPLAPWRTPVARLGFETRVPTSYAVLKRDKAVRSGLQRRYAASLQGAAVTEMDAGHNAPLSHPSQVAELLLGG